jgi:hypothetical protein
MRLKNVPMRWAPVRVLPLTTKRAPGRPLLSRPVLHGRLHADFPPICQKLFGQFVGCVFQVANSVVDVARFANRGLSPHSSDT